MTRTTATPSGPPAHGAVRDCAARCRGGNGSSPRRNRSRTSATVAGDNPARRAISRNDTPGSSRNSRHATSRARADPSPTARARPSRPTRTPDTSAPDARRIWATFRADNPATAATARSDHPGRPTTIRSAAATRSPTGNARPCRAFTATASNAASSTPPSKNRTAIRSSPRRLAAHNRCTPSTTVIDARCTTITPQPAPGSHPAPEPEPGTGPEPGPGPATGPEPGSEPEPEPDPESDSDSDSESDQGSEPGPQPGPDSASSATKPSSTPPPRGVNPTPTASTGTHTTGACPTPARKPAT
ncbi:hypothetical protein [Streptomyces bauhiniae]|uniref:hypothetical protein n=1 Tax=Streptomyces bauhiniae TaxID=2340725 RepID=UPI00345173F2